MSLRQWLQIPSWEWESTAAAEILQTLRDPNADFDERLIAAELAGDAVVTSTAMADALLAVIADAGASEGLRSQAAISLGPLMEQGDLEEFDFPGEGDFTEATFERVRQALRRLFDDPTLPDAVRRSILEASVRSPEKWHEQAIRTAQAHGGPWLRTALFCMGYIRGFEREIVAALGSNDAEIEFEAVRAAGNAGVAAAWNHIRALALNDGTERQLRLAAVEALPSIRPEQAAEELMSLYDTGDEELIEALEEGLSLAGVLTLGDTDDDSEW